MAERKYTLTKIAAGDYLLPSNDARTLWRIRRYEDQTINPPEPKGVPTNRWLWAVWKWTEAIDPSADGQAVDVEDWERWQRWDDTYETRGAAIEAALGQEGDSA